MYVSNIINGNDKYLDGSKHKHTPTHLLKQFRWITVLKHHTHTFISKTQPTIFISKMQPTGSSQNMAHRPISKTQPFGSSQKHGPPAHFINTPLQVLQNISHFLSQYKIISYHFTQCANESPTSRPGVMTVPLPRSQAHI